MRPVCSDCEKEMKPTQNGVLVYHPLEPLEKHDGGIDFVAHADEYTCPDCGSKIIKGFGKPILNTGANNGELKEIVQHFQNEGLARRMLRR